MKQICGTCNNFYCEECMLKNKYVDALKNACKHYSNFNKEEYRKRVNEIKKETKEIQQIERNMSNVITHIKINGKEIDINNVKNGEYV